MILLISANSSIDLWLEHIVDHLVSLWVAALLLDEVKAGGVLVGHGLVSLALIFISWGMQAYEIVLELSWRLIKGYSIGFLIYPLHLVNWSILRIHLFY